MKALQCEDWLWKRQDVNADALNERIRLATMTRFVIYFATLRDASHSAKLSAQTTCTAHCEQAGRRNESERNFAHSTTSVRKSGPVSLLFHTTFVVHCFYHSCLLFNCFLLHFDWSSSLLLLLLLLFASPRFLNAYALSQWLPCTHYNSSTPCNTHYNFITSLLSTFDW